MSEKPDNQTRDGFSILNKKGQFWSTSVYRTQETARFHLDEFWDKDYDISDFRIVRAQMEIRYLGEVDNES